MVNRYLKKLPKETYTLEELISELRSIRFEEETDNMEKIFNLVLSEFNITKKEIRSKRLHTKYTDARKVFCYLTKVYTLGTNKLISSMIKRSTGSTSINKKWVLDKINDNPNHRLVESIDAIKKQILHT